MAEQHHFLARSYLEGFAEPGTEKVWAATLDGKVFPSSPRKICRRRDYYAVPQSWLKRPPRELEDLFGMTETAVKPFLDAVLHGVPPITIPDRHALVSLAAISYARVPATREKLKRRYVEGLEGLARFLNQTRNASFPETGWNIGENTDLGMMVQCLATTTAVFDQMAVGVWRYETDCVLTGENPVLFSTSDLPEGSAAEPETFRLGETVEPRLVGKHVRMVVMPLNRRAHLFLQAKYGRRALEVFDGEPGLCHKLNTAVAAQSDLIIASSTAIIDSVHEAA